MYERLSCNLTYNQGGGLLYIASPVVYNYKPSEWLCGWSDRKLGLPGLLISGLVSFLAVSFPGMSMVFMFTSCRVKLLAFLSMEL